MHKKDIIDKLKMSMQSVEGKVNDEKEKEYLSSIIKYLSNYDVYNKVLNDYIYSHRMSYCNDRTNNDTVDKIKDALMTLLYKKDIKDSMYKMEVIINLVNYISHYDINNKILGDFEKGKANKNENEIV